MSSGSPDILVDNPFKKILKFIVFILILLVLICLIVSNFILYRQVETLSCQVTELQSQNKALSQQCEDFSSYIHNHDKKYYELRFDVDDLDRYDDILESRIKSIYHSLMRHNGSVLGCMDCAYFMLGIEK